MRNRVFVYWAIALAAFWIFANWPYRYGLAGFFQQAGFPFVFWFRAAGWEPEFSGLALTGNVVIGAMIVMGVASLCAWSRGKGQYGPTIRTALQEPQQSDQNSTGL
jgi:hypothetical protein